MTEQHPAQPEPTPLVDGAVETAEPKERVALGLLAALLPIVLGIAVTVAIWRTGYIAAITSFVMAIGAAYVYTAAAGRPARKGLAPLVLLIVLGVVVSFFGIVASDLWDAYDELSALGFDLGDSRVTFIREQLFESTVLREYGKDMAMFGLFAVLGIGGVIRSLFSQAA